MPLMIDAAVLIVSFARFCGLIFDLILLV